MIYVLFLNTPLNKCDIIIQQISFAENETIYKTSYLITLLCLCNNKSKVRGRVGPEKRIICVTIPRPQLSQAQGLYKEKERTSNRPKMEMSCFKFQVSSMLGMSSKAPVLQLHLQSCRTGGSWM